MRIRLNKSIDDGPFFGTLGEAVYFRYDESDKLLLHVLLYGWPGIWQVDPKDVDPIH